MRFTLKLHFKIITAMAKHPIKCSSKINHCGPDKKKKKNPGLKKEESKTRSMICMPLLRLVLLYPSREKGRRITLRGEEARSHS